MQACITAAGALDTGCALLNPFCNAGAACECSGAVCLAASHSTCNGIDDANANGVCQCGVAGNANQGISCDTTPLTPVCTAGADGMVASSSCQVNMAEVF